MMKGAGLCLALLVIASLAIGVEDLSLSGAGDRLPLLDLLSISRMPRTLAAVLTGAGLAVAGQIMQTLTRNRFVEPSTAGTAQSAALGILIVTLFLPSAGIGLKALVASGCALAGTALFLSTAHRLPPEQPHLVPLFGLVYGGVVGAAVTYVAWQNDLLQYLDIWMNGEFSGVLRGRYELLFFCVLLIAAALLAADRLTIMALGEGQATSLGIDYRRMTQIGLVLVSVMSALSVVVVGLVPFVGLVVPNLVSRIFGDNLRGTLPLVALCGAILVLSADIVGRLIRFPYEIPVGTVLGVVGPFVFLWLILQERRNA
ncbi:ABC transporter permease [Rhizobium sp. SSA_523]|uniref:ABC transporter permease n=1 Tax=Rhizobium sp. SSA_523 TaxID=2952477 RepID=UPI00209028F5|nr:iron chelate uptake ABC transporter family permease subunit [Rhizobium sp. SSA_523]MCO5733125.1 iron chelate uptake ABC transporter family permease subunit [Rhizobium sp. SSA_523]WKC23999.1 iron chelate uptake ABC transporter family permease subunit [Rhizobium sp. SSA_523]